MPQTQDGMSFIEALVIASPDGVAWTEVSYHGASVAVSGGDRATGEQHTFGAQVTPIVKAGKLGSQDVTVRFVYTEIADDPFDVARTARESADGQFWVQYQPKTGGNWFATGQGVITSLLYPGGEAGPGDVIMSEFVVKTAGLTEAAASV